MKFRYKAVNEMGTTVSGALEADTLEAAQAILNARGYIPTSVQSGDSALQEYLDRLKTGLAKVKFVDLIFFTKQFRTLFKAGISITEGLKIMEAQSSNKKMKQTLAKMGEDIKAGSGLADSFARHPGVFPEIYTSMIRAGETSGSLPSVLDRLVYILDHEHKVKTSIRSAMTYPVVVVVALFGAFIFLLTFVVPTFANMFKGIGIDLPWPTAVAIRMHTALIEYWMVSLPIFLAVVFALYWYQKTPPGRLMRDKMLLGLPILGPVFAKAAMSRFCSIFSILQISGVTVLESLAILSKAIGNSAISREFDKIGDQLREGRGISTPLKSAKYFTPMVVSMVAVGEEAGNLVDMLHDVAVHYDDEVEYEVSRMTELLGPFLLVALAGVVGFFALAIFMPMWDMVKMVN